MAEKQQKRTDKPENITDMYSKNFLLIALLLIAAASAALITGLAEENARLKASNAFKMELLILNDSLMRCSDRVMDNNSLWDRDGSDDMASYLEYHAKIDSIYAEEL